ncbi:acetyl-CoA carboxylase biotin carboxyl carrier protein [uncultured Sneathiella sp.]|uniref:acetyl-CoA carboxylase biotin carboxyl carrier protein n=1 Tax=uncultured Sneathiella sp. TaxID=879315 RepID=UPI00259390E5|nr:acetyl-CoA carboxylase biotin carboxyl carrier protein [uncultured Sneathiella sp.]
MNKLNIDKKAIRDLAEIMNETGLGEIEIENGDHRLRVSRGSSAASEAIQTVIPAAPVAAPAAAPAAAAPDAGSHPGAVKSPMVGTVYLSPEPGSAPFVRPGDMISEGQTLLIVEAMKTMNPIAAPKSGKVIEILVGNEEPVEYGQPLAIIE